MLAKREDFVQNTVGNFTFAHFGKGTGAFFGDECNNVCINTKASAVGSHIIGNDQVQIFLFQFGLRIFENVLGFGCKTNQYETQAMERLLRERGCRRDLQGPTG